MIETAEKQAPEARVTSPRVDNGREATRMTGATLFSELVRAHYRSEAEEERGGVDGGKARADFEAKLTEFEQKVGQIDRVYWSSRRPSAVALTIGEPHGFRNPFRDTDTEARLHRVTDWVTGDRSEIADLLHDCDLLAIRVGEVLRGASERITMRWIFSVQEHLLGFFERIGYVSPRRRRWWTPNGKKSGSDMDREEQRVVAAQRQELAKIEEYYLRIAGKAGRIVYVTGMIVGAVFIALLCTLVAVVLAVWYPRGWTANESYLLLCAGAGAAGALTSVLARMNSIGGRSRSTSSSAGRCCAGSGCTNRSSGRSSAWPCTGFSPPGWWRRRRSRTRRTTAASSSSGSRRSLQASASASPGSSSEAPSA